MTTASIDLEGLERDALTELVNIGVSRAAASLRTMVGEQVLLSVPSVEVVTRTTASVLIREREAGPLVAVRQDFRGAFSGQALLAFRVRIVGESPALFIRDFVVPALHVAGRDAAEGHADAETVEYQPTSEPLVSPNERS